MKRYGIILILNILSIFQLYSQALLPDPGSQTIISDFGPRNSIGTRFHQGIDYPTALNTYRTAVEAGTIRGFGSKTQNGAMMSFGNWGYRHMQCNSTADRHWEFWTNPQNGIEYLIRRADGPNNTHTTIAIYAVAPSAVANVRDPFTGNTVAVTTQFNQGDICFAAGPYDASAPHLHLETRAQTENPLSRVTHIDTQNPIVNVRFFYPENGHAVQFPTNNNNTLYGNSVVITADVNVINDKDLNVVEYFNRRNSTGNNTFTSLNRWQYTGGSLNGNNVIVLNSEAAILRDLQNPIHGVVYPFGQTASRDYFKYGWQIQERLGTGEPRYPDGRYIVRVSGIDITGHRTDQDNNVIIDNNRPYVKHLVIMQGSSTLYAGDWVVSNNSLNYLCSADKESNAGKNLTIKIRTSEQMNSVLISIPKLGINSASCTSIDDSGEWWKYELSKDRFNVCNEDIKKLNGKLSIELTGTDVSGNQIEGFGENENTRALNSLPLHLSNGNWNPAPNARADRRHYLKIKIEPLKCEWETNCIFAGRCFIPPIYMLTAKASGGRPFEEGDPYQYEWKTKIISSQQNVHLWVKDQFCFETINREVSVVAPGGCSKDPNDITGPEGYGDKRWVSKIESLNYKIRFENDPKEALGPAQKVIVRYPIDKNANMYSVELAEFGFGDFTYQIPPKTSNYSARLNVVDSLGVYVDVIAGLDIAKHEVFWIFQSIDPKTGMKPYANNLGFLLKNDSITHRGEGFVNFKIQPIQTALTGDTISAQANIVFDQNESILTNRVFNTIDALPPVTYVKPLPAIMDSTQFRVTLKGVDDRGGSGISKYDLYVSENKGPYNQYNTISGDTSILFKGSMGNSYDFFTRSWDNVYNSEKNKNKAEASVVLKPKNIIISPKASSHFCLDNKLKIVWRHTNIDAFDIELSDDNAKTFRSIASSVFARDTIYETEIPANIDLTKNYCIRLVNSLNKIVIETSELFKFHPKIKVDAGFDRLICNKDSVQIGGNPSALNGVEPYTYKWLTSMGLNSYNTSNPYARYEDSYALEVHDAYGCWNRDTVVVTNSNSEKLVFYGLDEKYCLQASPVTLNATPIGGVFSGLGIVNNIFYPSTAGAGNHAITYTHTNSNGCKKDTTVYVEVLEQSKVILSDVLNDYCVDSDTVHLNPQPAGGVFSGDGVVGNHFVPLKAGAGLHRIKYTFSDVTGCVAIYEFDINVHSKPDLTVVGLENSYCVNSPVDTLRGVPVGGVFGGIGISNGIFNPATAGAGSHQITYQYTSPYGCSNSIVTSTLVNSLPAVSISGLNDHYCENATPIALNGTPASGVFQGIGVNSGKFYPSTAGVGIHNIQYTYTDVNMCSNSAIQQVEVIKKPNVTFLGLDDSYCINSGAADLTGRPAGGHFSGNGIMGSAFNPSVAGIGNHFISYSYTASSGCSNDTLKSVKVNSLPYVSLGRDTSITTVETVTLNAGNGFKNYKWSDGSTAQTLALSGAALGKGTHKFWVEVSDNNSCSATDTILVKVSDNVDIDILNSLVKLRVYPNPSTGLFYLDIENSSSENIYVEVRNNAGQVVYSKKFKGRFEDIKAEINLLGKAKGVYYINVKVKQEQATRKIVII